jgi:hypothetical protein
MPQKTKSSPNILRVRPIDVVPGDLVRNRSLGNCTVLSSELVEPDTRKVDSTNRNTKHEWWITYLYADQEGRVHKQTERFPRRKFATGFVDVIRDTTLPSE